MSQLRHFSHNIVKILKFLFLLIFLIIFPSYQEDKFLISDFISFHFISAYLSLCDVGGVHYTFRPMTP